MKHMPDLPEDVRARILEKRGAGEHHFRGCPLCGHMSWVTTIGGKPTSVIVEEDDGIDRCPVCTEVFLRAPELARWVVDVVRYQGDKAKAEPPTPAGSS